MFDMKKNNDKLFNYTLSVGFIVIILIFLVLIIQISRIVFNDDNSIQEHVSTTKNLLDNINEVEKSVEKNEELTHQLNQNMHYSTNKISNYQENVKDVSYLNINEDKAIISIVVDSEIHKIENTYYLKTDNINDLAISDNIVFLDENIYLGKIFEIEDDSTIKLITLDNQSTKIIDFTNVLGKVVIQTND